MACRVGPVDGLGEAPAIAPSASTAAGLQQGGSTGGTSGVAPGIDYPATVSAPPRLRGRESISRLFSLLVYPVLPFVFSRSSFSCSIDATDRVVE